MSLLRKIRRLHAKQLWALSKVFLAKPQYLFPTYRATRQTIKIANNKFGKAHHENNVTNAFRHGLWNFLIAENCYAKNNSVEKSIQWAERITNLHEKLMPNKSLPAAMDLHNNVVGRKLFEKHHPLPTEAEKIKVFTELMTVAKKIESIEDIPKTEIKLVYIEAYGNER